MLKLYDQLIGALLPGKILAVQVGLTRTAVLAESDDGLRCGLAATLSSPEFRYSHRPPVRHAGHLHKMSAVELAGLVHSDSLSEVSIGMATINALLPHHRELWLDLHSRDLLIRLGAGKTVVVVGHFPFVPELRAKVGRLLVLEQNPRDADDIPADRAPEIIPQADVVAMTAMTLLNHTFEDLMALCLPGVPIIIIGPTTPLSPILFERGATVLCGAVAENPEAILCGLREGANSQQLHQLGLRFVSMSAESLW